MTCLWELGGGGEPLGGQGQNIPKIPESLQNVKWRSTVYWVGMNPPPLQKRPPGNPG